jgi:ABC-type multidrug transport system fused ATPase/permease subunit
MQTAIPFVDRIIAEIETSDKYRRSVETLGLDPLPTEPRVLSFSNVWFTYQGANGPALAGVTLDIPIGSTIGIAGSSGAGKSTLADLVLGLLSPTSGDISLDGVPLEQVLKAWRARIGYVPQDVVLFDGTVAQNVALTWGNDMDRSRVERALRRAQLWDAVQSRDAGLDERLGEGGMAFSGGQRQRLGIARALYSDPLVLVLDEATSALDNLTESEVTKAIRTLGGEITVITIAHRLSTIRGSDMVIFLSNGTITGMGSFDDVVRKNDEFAVLARLAGLA